MTHLYYSLFDIVGVSLLVVAAFWCIIRTFIKVSSNKCGTICNGCTTSKCKTKTFYNKPLKLSNPHVNKAIVIHPKN